MDEVIRATLRDALDVKEPVGLRARVIASVPMGRKGRVRRRPMRGISLQWAAGLAAIVVTAALLGGLVGSRIAVRPSTTRPTGPAVRMTTPSGIAIAPNGTVYVADFLGGRILRVQPNGTLVSVAGGGLKAEGPGVDANVFGPLQIAFGPDGNLYIGEDGGTRISRLDTHGNVSTVASTYGAVSGLAFNSFGVLFASLDQVQSILPAGRAPLDLAAVGGPRPWPGYLTFDKDDNMYIADRAPVTTSIELTPPAPGGCRILRALPDNEVSVIAGTGRCGFSGDGGPATNAELNDPRGLAVDSAGNIYFADSSNRRIRRIDTHGIITTVAGPGSSLGDLGYMAGVALAQDRYLYFAEQTTASAAYGAVLVLDLRTGSIRKAVDSFSRVLS
jgi:sugar lactone lactonase YvrE